MTRKKKPLAEDKRRSEPASVASPSAVLVARWEGGDQDAAREIFERYVDRLTRLARVRLSAKLAARLDADDVVMSAYRSFFVGARDGRFSFAKSGDLWRLLVEITLHKLYRAVAHHRAQRRSVDAEFNQERADAAGEAGPWLSREPAPDEVVAVADELQAILAKLSPLGRRVLELRLQGEEVESIAHEVHRSVKTVRRALDEAQRLLAARRAAGNEPPVVKSGDRRRSGARVDSVAAQKMRADASVIARDAEPEPAKSPRVSQRKFQRPVRRRLLNYGDYLLQRLVGAGASGKVYVAIRRSDSARLAVKFLRKSFLRQPAIVDRFVREADVLKRLRHPRIIRVHGLGRTLHGGYFIVMDLAPGGDLAARIADGPVAINDAVRWTREAAEAIEHAHRHGVIHCDLKPSNLLLDDAGHVLVSDFGLARRNVAAETSLNIIAGTPAFMAPEQVADCWGAIGPHSDVYGLGAVLYTLLTSRPPFAGPRAADILAEIVSGLPVTPPDQIRGDIPSRVERVCVRCLAKRPDQRFASAVDVTAALRDCC